MADPQDKDTAKDASYAAFRLMAAMERDVADESAKLARAGQGDAEHWDRLTQLWQTALDVAELYRTDPLFAGRVDGAIWEHKRRTAGMAEKGRS